MNTPLTLASVALLAGVAARPIDNDRLGHAEDLRELVRSPDHDDRQAFLARIPPGLDALNSLQLHDLHDKTHVQTTADAQRGSTSPKLSGVGDGLSDPDPGLESPYMGPQTHLTSIEQELDTPSIEQERDTPTLSSVVAPPDSHYSPMVVPLVLASLASLVLLGLAVAVACVTHLLRRTVFRPDLLRAVIREKGGVSWSEKGGVAPAPGSPCVDKPSDADPDLMPLPENPPEPVASAVPALHRGQNHDRALGLAFAAWTYDNWLTHFMMALFGWFGAFLGGTSVNGRQ